MQLPECVQLTVSIHSLLFQAESLAGTKLPKPLPACVEKFRAWTVKQMSMARKRMVPIISSCPPPPSNAL